MVRRTRLLTSALLAGFLALPASAVAAPPTIGGFSARPVALNGKEVAAPFFSVDAAPGSSATLDILVANASKTTVRLHVDPVDAATSATSGIAYRNRTEPVREAGGWLTAPKQVLRLAPGDQRTLRAQLQIPAGAKAGDHVAAIALQRVIPARSSGTFAVRQVLRVAVALQIRVAGAAISGAKVAAAPRLAPLPGTQIPAVIVPLVNSGRLLCKPEVQVDLTREGVVIGTVTKQLDTVLPGDRIEYPLPWPRPLEAGRYRLRTDVRGCGDSDRTTSEATLTSALRGTTSAPGPDAGVAPGGGGGVPWWALLLGLPLAAGGGYLVAWWRRRRPRAETTAEPVAAAAIAKARVVDPANGPAAGT